MDEQAKTSILNENIRLKEVQERKWEAEMEALNFRNQQLTKRIEVLQDEQYEHQHYHQLQQHQGGSKKKQKHADMSAVKSSETLNSVIGKELQAKIDENARLHAKLSDIDQRYEELVSSLQSKIKDLEAESKRRDQAERAEDSQSRDLIQGLQADNAQLRSHMKEAEKEIIDLQDKVTLLTVQLESATNDVSTSSPSKPLMPAGPGIMKSASDNSVSSSFPLSANDALVQSVELLSQFGEIITELVANLSDFHTYWEHRLKDTHSDGPMSSNAASLSKLLLQNVKYLKPIEEAFQSVMSKVLSRDKANNIQGKMTIVMLFRQFSESFAGYVAFACEAEPLTVACLQYESNLYSCPPSQQAKNSQLQSSLRALNRTWVRLGDYLKELTSEDKARSIEAVENVTVIVSQLYQELNEFASIYSAKALDENQLPTVTEHLKNTNQCLVSALSGMVSSVNSLSRQLSDSLPRIIILIKAGCFVPVEDTSVVPTGDDKKIDVLALSEDGATDMEMKLEEAQERKNLLENHVTELNQKLQKLEQDMEHWKLEYQLLRMKYHKVQGVDDSKEEEELRNEFLDRVVGERLLADGKASAFYFESVSLKKRADHAESRRQIMAKRLESSVKQIQLLQEEVRSTSANYESQLGMMTEHVAGLNDKLTLQTDEIERLKYELGQKGKSKR